MKIGNISHMKKDADDKNVQEIIHKGYPANETSLPNLINALNNANSSEFSDVAEYLLSLGSPVIPYVKAAINESLYGNDYGQWQSNILFTQVRHWNKEMVSRILPELFELLDFGSDDWDVRFETAQILIKNQFIENTELKSRLIKWKENCIRKLR